MKTYQKILSGIVIAAVFAVIGILSNSQTVSATLQLFYNEKSFVQGTTTKQYQTPGAATTTLVLDSYRSGTGKALDSASFMLQLTASTTGSSIAWNYEYSQDGIDWYGDNVLLAGTSTGTINVAAFNTYIWAYSTTTIGTSVGPSAAGLNGRALKLVTMPVPTRYARVKIYTPIGSANNAVWAQFVSKGQI